MAAAAAYPFRERQFACLGRVFPGNPLDVWNVDKKPAEVRLVLLPVGDGRRIGGRRLGRTGFDDRQRFLTCLARRPALSGQSVTQGQVGWPATIGFKAILELLPCLSHGTCPLGSFVPSAAD